MCQHGEWRGFTAVTIDNPQSEHNFAIVEQCDLCLDYRAVVADDMKLTTVDSGGTNDVDEKERDSDESGWSVDR